MALEAPLGKILEEASDLLGRLRASRPETPEKVDSESARRLFVIVPAIVNVLLNYKICSEHGLPLHPTVYYELKEARKYRMDHPIADIERANRLFRAAIELARSAYRLSETWDSEAEAFRAGLPREILTFVYTGGSDKYTWRASEPAKISALASKVREEFAPQLIVAAAHGSIMPGLLLAELLDRPLYFLRFSMFKRSDEAPIISIGDETWLSTWRDKPVLLYDEDVAKGTTLALFAERVGKLFSNTKTACSIRHAGSSIKPDFFARTWWD